MVALLHQLAWDLSAQGFPSGTRELMTGPKLDAPLHAVPRCAA